MSQGDQSPVDSSYTSPLTDICTWPGVDASRVYARSFYAPAATTQITSKRAASLSTFCAKRASHVTSVTLPVRTIQQRCSVVAR